MSKCKECNGRGYHLFVMSSPTCGVCGGTGRQPVAEDPTCLHSVADSVNTSADLEVSRLVTVYEADPWSYPSYFNVVHAKPKNANHELFLVANSTIPLLAGMDVCGVRISYRALYGTAPLEAMGLQCIGSVCTFPASMFYDDDLVDEDPQDDASIEAGSVAGHVLGCTGDGV